jgi:hypothetical protein
MRLLLPIGVQASPPSLNRHAARLGSHTGACLPADQLAHDLPLEVLMPTDDNRMTRWVHGRSGGSKGDDVRVQIIVATEPIRLRRIRYCEYERRRESDIRYAM